MVLALTRSPAWREVPGKTTGDAKAPVARSLISDDDEEDSVESTWFDRPGDLASLEVQEAREGAEPRTGTTEVEELTGNLLRWP